MDTIARAFTAIRNEPLRVYTIVTAALAFAVHQGYVALDDTGHALLLAVVAAILGLTRGHVAGPVTWREMVAAEDVFEAASRDG